jgi:hypothetical protein
LGLYNRPEVAAVPGDVSPTPLKKKGTGESRKMYQLHVVLENNYFVPLYYVYFAINEQSAKLKTSKFIVWGFISNTVTFQINRN